MEKPQLLDIIESYKIWTPVLLIFIIFTNKVAIIDNVFEQFY